MNTLQRLLGCCLLCAWLPSTWAQDTMSSHAVAAGLQCAEQFKYQAIAEQCLAKIGTANRFQCFRGQISQLFGEQATPQPAQLEKILRDSSEQVGSLLDQEILSPLLLGTVSDLPIPALNGVLDNFSSGLLPSMLPAVGHLDAPQTFGASVVLPRIFYTRTRLSGFANPAPEINTLLEEVLIQRGQLESFRKDERQLELKDDYYLSAELSVLGPWLGRDLADHAQAKARLIRTVIAGRDVDGGDLPTQAPLDRLTSLLMTAEPTPADIASFSCQLAQYHRLAATANHRAYAEDQRIDAFWRFVNNQPQLTLGLRQLHREDIVGADIDSYRIKFSSGLFNNLTFLKLLPGCSRELGDDDCPRKYRNMLDSFAMKHDLGVSAYAEWGDIADMDVALPSLTDATINSLLPPVVADTVLPDDDLLHVSGGGYRRYGWSLGGSLHALKTADAGKESKFSLRLDGGVDYYRYSNDPLRFDHEVARITLTLRRGDYSFPFHLMYRAKSEFSTELNDGTAVAVGVQADLGGW